MRRPAIAHLSGLPHHRCEKLPPSKKRHFADDDWQQAIKQDDPNEPSDDSSEWTHHIIQAVLSASFCEPLRVNIIRNAVVFTFRWRHTKRSSIKFILLSLSICICRMYRVCSSNDEKRRRERENEKKSFLTKTLYSGLVPFICDRVSYRYIYIGMEQRHVASENHPSQPPYLYTVNHIKLRIVVVVVDLIRFGVIMLFKTLNTKLACGTRKILSQKKKEFSFRLNSNIFVKQWDSYRYKQDLIFF